MSGPGHVRDVLGRRISGLLDVLFPPRCLKCGSGVDRAGMLCARCWSAIKFITPPLCAACGQPFDHDPGEGALCAACASVPPPFDRARAVFVYGDESRDLILGLKHGDKTHAAPAFAEWMARPGSGLVADAELLAPVPLHRRRLFSRRFNQAALLAYYLAPRSPGRLVPDLLVRRRATPPQGRMNTVARQRNVRGAFDVRSDAMVAGKRVLLLDDVFTTGATVAECARVLARAGARAVDVLTLARVVRAGDPF